MKISSFTLEKKSGLSNDHCTIYQHMPIKWMIGFTSQWYFKKKRKRIKKKLTSSRRNFRLPKGTRDRWVNCYDEHQIWKFHDFHFFSWISLFTKIKKIVYSFTYFESFDQHWFVILFFSFRSSMSVDKWIFQIRNKSLPLSWLLRYIWGVK